MDIFARLVKLVLIYRDQDKRLAELEKGVEDGIIDPAEALDRSSDIVDECKALADGRDTKQFMNDRKLEAQNYL